MNSLNRSEYFSTDHLRADLKKHAIRGAGATVFANISGYFFQMIGTIILARLLTPDDFGLISMVTAFSLLFMGFGANGFTEAIIQKDVINHTQVSTIFWIHVGISSILTLFFIGLAPIMVWFYKEPRLQSVTIALAFSIFFTSLYTAHMALLKRNMSFYLTSANEILSMIVATAASIAVAFWGWGYWSLVARRVAPQIALVVGAWLMCKWRPGLPALRSGVKSMIKFALNAYGNFSFNYCSKYIDKILIGWRHSTQALGHYSNAYHLFIMPSIQFSYPLLSVAVATLSRLNNEPEKYRHYFLKSISTVAFIGMGLSVWLTLIGKDLILLLLGPQWQKAGQIFTAFGPSIGIMLIYNSHSWIHLSIGRADRWFRWSIVSLVTTVILFILGLPFGPLGVAIAYSASFYVLIGPALWYAGRPIQLKLSYVLSAVWKYFIAVIISGTVCWYVLYSFHPTSRIFLELNLLSRIFIASTLCITLYLLFIIVFFRNLKPVLEVIALLRDMVPKAFSKESK